MNTNSLTASLTTLDTFDNYSLALELMDYLPTEQDYQDWMLCLQEEQTEEQTRQEEIEYDDADEDDDDFYNEVYGEVDLDHEDYWNI